MTKLQYALSLSPDQVSSLPPPIVRIRELEEENQQLLQQIEDLRKELDDRNVRLRVATTAAAPAAPSAAPSSTP